MDSTKHKLTLPFTPALDSITTLLAHLNAHSETAKDQVQPHFAYKVFTAQQ